MIEPRALSDADKAILAVTHFGNVLKAVLDLKRFQRDHDATDTLLKAHRLFDPAQADLLIRLVLDNTL